MIAHHGGIIDTVAFDTKELKRKNCVMMSAAMGVPSTDQLGGGARVVGCHVRATPAKLDRGQQGGG
jgi:hypothetical protein